MNAADLYAQAVVIDGLNVSNWDSPNVYAALRTGDVTAINATVATWENFQETMDHIAIWLRRFAERDDVLQVKTVADIHVAKERGKTGIILGFQNASPIENNLERLRLFHSLGVRVIQLTYHERNLLGNGCYERTDEGISNFGVDAIRLMNEIGILIDLSHVGDRTTLETIDTSERPVCVTHANANTFCPHPRNKEDETLKRLAARGGIVGATSFAPFLPGGFDATLSDFIDSLDYMVQLVGIDNVAFGTDNTQDQPLSFWHYIASQQGTQYPSTFANTDQDYLGNCYQPKDLETPAQFPNLAGALLDRGYSEEDAQKLLGGNWLRLFSEVWQ